MGRSVGVLGLFSGACCRTNENSNSKALVNDEVIVYKGRTMKVVVPECPLGLGSVKIIPTSNRRNFYGWEESNKLEAHELLQNVVKIWEKKGITDYLIYGKESKGLIFGWEIVPYPKTGWKYWKQFRVLWNITFGARCLPIFERQRIAEDFQKDKDSFSATNTKQIEITKKTASQNDAFCNPNIIDKQLIFEGKEINVLYNYAPLFIGKEKLHFLVVPKRHLPKFSDLSKSEYLESMQLTQKLINIYKNKGFHTVYLFDKTGDRAGQTVSHFHGHVVITAAKNQVFLGLAVLKNMLFGSSPLKQNELQSRVEAFRKELSTVLKSN